HSPHSKTSRRNHMVYGCSLLPVQNHVIRGAARSPEADIEECLVGQICTSEASCSRASSHDGRTVESQAVCQWGRDHGEVRGHLNEITRVVVLALVRTHAGDRPHASGATARY